MVEQPCGFPQISNQRHPNVNMQEQCIPTTNSHQRHCVLGPSSMNPNQQYYDYRPKSGAPLYPMPPPNVFRQNVPIPPTHNCMQVQRPTDPRLARMPRPPKPRQEAPVVEVQHTEVSPKPAPLNRRRISIYDYRRYTEDPTERDKDLAKEQHTDEIGHQQKDSEDSVNGNSLPESTFSPDEESPASFPETPASSSCHSENDFDDVVNAADEEITVKVEPLSGSQSTPTDQNPGQTDYDSDASDATVEFTHDAFKKETDFFKTNESSAPDDEEEGIFFVFIQKQMDYT